MSLGFMEAESDEAVDTDELVQDVLQEFNALEDQSGYFTGREFGLVGLYPKVGWGHGPQVARSDLYNFSIDLMKHTYAKNMGGKFTQGIKSVTSPPNFFDVQVCNVPLDALHWSMSWAYTRVGSNEESHMYEEKPQYITTVMLKRERARLALAFRRSGDG